MLPSDAPVSWALFLFQKSHSDIFLFFLGSHHEKYGNDTKNTGDYLWLDGLGWGVF